MKRLLLDTHLVLWWIASDRRLGASTRRVIETSSCAVSVITLAELAMKTAAGKVRLPQVSLDEVLLSSGIAILPLGLPHVQAAARLMGHHPDPFDCLLVGTALAERMTLATRDAALLASAASLLGDLMVEA